jgi:NAD(P)H-hydrate epimerase
MKILSTLQMREADLYTIKHEPIESIDLMERAAKQLLKAILTDHSQAQCFYILCGKGNNGGDGLALARLLYQHGKQVGVFIINHTSNKSDDFSINLERLSSLDIEIIQINSVEELPKFDDRALIVDAILGSGLNKPLKGWLTKLIDYLNGLKTPKLAVDIPTGLFADDNAENDLKRIFQANYTYTFQLPKLSFFHRDTLSFVGEYRILNIQIHPDFIGSALSTYHFFESSAAKSIFKHRKKHTYKSSYGHALLIAGSRGKIGAALLAGKACLCAGVGLLTVRIPGCGELPFQSSFPEAMVTLDSDFNQITEIPKDLE